MYDADEWCVVRARGAAAAIALFPQFPFSPPARSRAPPPPAVQCFGTESRQTEKPYAPLDKIYAAVEFKAADIADVHVHPEQEDPVYNDPIIMSAVPSDRTAPRGGAPPPRAPPSSYAAAAQQDRRPPTTAAAAAPGRLAQGHHDGGGYRAGGVAQQGGGGQGGRAPPPPPPPGPAPGMPGAASQLREFGFTPGMRQRVQAEARQQFDFEASQEKMEEALSELHLGGAAAAAPAAGEEGEEKAAAKPVLAAAAYSKGSFFDTLKTGSGGGGGRGGRGSDKS
jgi:hypothetical protein